MTRVPDPPQEAIDAVARYVFHAHDPEAAFVTWENCTEDAELLARGTAAGALTMARESDAIRYAFEVRAVEERLEEAERLLTLLYESAQREGLLPNAHVDAFLASQVENTEVPE